MQQVCSNCGLELEPETPACPACGSGDRIIIVRDVVRFVRPVWLVEPDEG